MKPTRSMGGAGDMPLLSSAARMNQSMGVAGQLTSFTSGSAGRDRGLIAHQSSSADVSCPDVADLSVVFDVPAFGKAGGAALKRTQVMPAKMIVRSAGLCRNCVAIFDSGTR